MSKPIIAIDADGVLLNYNFAYAQAWERAFGEFPAEADPHAYLAINRWQVEWLGPEKISQFQAVFDDEFWSTVPALPGAVDATKMLHAAGYDLVCVSAINNQWAQARFRNLHDLGMPISAVFGVDSKTHDLNHSPKAEILAKLKPVAFIDDYLPYFSGVTGMHRALLNRSPDAADNPKNSFGALADKWLEHVDSTHASLAHFAYWWMMHKH